MQTFIEHLIQKQAPCIFISPHLDDAILSCGNLMTELKGKTKMHVITLFTEAGEKPQTLSARMFLKQCGVPDTHELFALRRTEDEKVLGEIGATWKHLGFTDALWRKRAMSKLMALVGKWIPELIHIRNIEQTLRNLFTLFPEAILFFPLGLGKHVDHVLTHELGLHFSPNVVFYSDFPYCLSDHPDERGLIQAGFQKHCLTSVENPKDRLIKLYATQPLFLGAIPVTPETYFFPTSLFSH
jgi:LmbE family N-acetylglucosaminyl deacetylase